MAHKPEISVTYTVFETMFCKGNSFLVALVTGALPLQLLKAGLSNY